MASNIDPTKPQAGAALTQNVRDNFQDAKDEIDALQAFDATFVDPILNKASPGNIGATTEGTGKFSTLETTSTTTLGDDVTYTITNMSILAGTSDGSDNAQLEIAGGGAAATSRGASIELNGEESGTPGALILKSGDSGNVEVSGIIDASLDGIYLGTAAAANLLDDYEEGTWTPVIADAESAGNTAAITPSNATYTKIGRQVTITALISNINTAGMTAGNAIYIRGFPFTSGASNFTHSGGILTDGFTFAGNFLTLAVGGSKTTATIKHITSGAADASLLVSAIDGATSDLFITLTYFT